MKRTNKVRSFLTKALITAIATVVGTGMVMHLIHWFNPDAPLLSLKEFSIMEAIVLASCAALFAVFFALGSIPRIPDWFGDWAKWKREEGE